MSLILAQFVLEILLTMCKAYQDFYNQTVYKNRIIGLICSINLLQSSLFLKFNTFINILTTFLFNSTHPTPNASIKLFVWFPDLLLCCLISQKVHLNQTFNSEKFNTTIISFFHHFHSTKQVIEI